MELKSIIKEYKPALIKKHGDKLMPNQYKAMHSIERCRTAHSGQLYVQCKQCAHTHWTPLSCGHRFCPTCQNHEVDQWLDRQKQKLLPVDYFMVTFSATAPALLYLLHPCSRLYPPNSDS